jgi:hypothetical protein
MDGRSNVCFFGWNDNFSAIAENFSNVLENFSHMCEKSSLSRRNNVNRSVQMNLPALSFGSKASLVEATNEP